MTRNTCLAITAAVALAAGVGGMSGVAFSKGAEAGADEAAIMANAKVTMAQAIATAKSQSGGKAVGSGIENQDGVVAWEVDVLKDGKTNKVLVDTQTGQITKTVVADSEQKEGGEANDGN